MEIKANRTKNSIQNLFCERLRHHRITRLRILRRSMVFRQFWTLVKTRLMFPSWAIVEETQRQMFQWQYFKGKVKILRQHDLRKVKKKHYRSSQRLFRVPYKSKRLGGITMVLTMLNIHKMQRLSKQVKIVRKLRKLVKESRTSFTKEWLVSWSRRNRAACKFMTKCLSQQLEKRSDKVFNLINHH